MAKVFVPPPNPYPSGSWRVERGLDPHVADLQGMVTELQEQVAQLEMELEMLKAGPAIKAAAYATGPIHCVACGQSMLFAGHGMYHSEAARKQASVSCANVNCEEFGHRYKPPVIPLERME